MVVVVLAVTLGLALIPYTSGWTPSLTHRTWTYEIIGCDVAWEKATVDQAIRNWQTWVPEVAWTPSQKNPDVTIECVLQTADGTAYVTGGTVVLPLWCFAKRYDAQGGLNYVDHELGHLYGLADGEGVDWEHYSETAFVIQPKPGSLQQVREYYASLPVPEFPAPLLWLVICLFAFWTPMMRRKVTR